LPEPVADAIDEGDLAVAAVLSATANFEGRIRAQVGPLPGLARRLSLLNALAGTIRTNLRTDRSAKTTRASRSICATSGRASRGRPYGRGIRCPRDAFKQR